MLRKIEQVNIPEDSTKRALDVFNNDKFEELASKSFHPYVHWEKLKYWNLPKGISNLDLWIAIKFLRNRVIIRKETPIKDEQGRFFTWGFVSLDGFLYEVDMKLSGSDSLLSKSSNDNFKNRLLSRGVMEEAIASSQLEGAHTSRKAAKRILLEGKKPRNKDEKMIVNNYQAMKRIEMELKDKKLDEETIFSLHRTITKEVLDKSEVGRYRKDKDDIVVASNIDDEIYHIPPKEKFVKKEIKRLISYANDDRDSQEFIHPVIKAIIIHFWFAYLHPFTDGNGRLARALFYWSLLKDGYWTFSYLPLSRIIKNSPAKYRDAFIYSEQDDNDLNYFIDYNISKIKQAMNDFEVYVNKKWKENAEMANIARDNYQLNDRQIQLLKYYYKNRNVSTSITTHSKVYEISRLTAMKDLQKLKQLGFLSSKKSGRVVYYYATKKVDNLFS
jgi:Fic family protein